MDGADVLLEVVYEVQHSFRLRGVGLSSLHFLQECLVVLALVLA